jgi:subfamily B ATP-binding cassette protein MsbA
VKITEQLYRTVEKSARVRSATSPIMEALGGMSIAAIFLYGGFQVINGDRSAGDLVSFIGALLLAYTPLKSLAGLQANFQEGLAAADRIFHIMDIEPDIKDQHGAKPLMVTAGHIRLEEVSFQYAENVPALRGINIDIPAGRKIALVGASGAGKSTILNLIPRFYDVNSGSVSIDGVDIREVTLASLRSAVGFVSQEISLFDDTVRSNIAYGKPGASDSEIESAAMAAAAHDFILRLPQGYETLVGENGVRLSGGQRQRISIARAMVKDAPILLLDEATSTLDSRSERAIQGALRRLSAGRTTVVIAHRLSTIIDADLIYVIDDGRVIEVGTHIDLLNCQSAYATMWAAQFLAQK